MRSAIDIVQRFHQMKVLVIGDAVLDSYLEGEAARLSRDGPIPVVRKTLEQRLLGGAANTAANLQALGASVSFLSLVGADLAGDLLRKALRERALSDEWVLSDPSLSTPHKLRILANGQHIARFDEGGMRLSASEMSTGCEPLFPMMEALYARCDVVLISDYGYGVISDALIQRLQELVVAHPKTIVVDSQMLHRFEHLSATIVTPNYTEARTFVEMKTGRRFQEPSGETLEDVQSLATYLMNALSVEYVAVTLAERGVFLKGRQEEVALHLPARPVENAQDVGAGDSFASALALALAAQCGIEEALRIGIDSAGIAVSKPRTAVVSHQELLQRVSLRTYTTQLQESMSEESLTHVQTQIEIERISGKTIVFANGIFDVLHVGHVKFLREAKELGAVLVVAVNNDRTSRLLKGIGRPVNNERDRLSLVAALEMVDYVLLFDQTTSTDLVRLLKPDVYVKGGDYTNESLPEAEAIREIGAKLVILPLIGS